MPGLPASTSSTFKIAVTGCPGSGKSVVCNRLGHLGAFVISADQIARSITETGSAAYQKIVQSFGSRILMDDGRLNRAMLRHIIIHDPAMRQELERITHPEIVKLMDSQIRNAEQAGEIVIVVEVPLLFELHLEKRFDVTVAVSVDYEAQIQRLMQRDKVSRKDASALLAAQLPDEEKAQSSDYIIKNDGSLERLHEKVDELYRLLYQKFIMVRQKRLTEVLP